MSERTVCIGGLDFSMDGDKGPFLEDHGFVALISAVERALGVVPSLCVGEGDGYTLTERGALKLVGKLALPFQELIEAILAQAFLEARCALNGKDMN